ncbi:MAG: extracellular solute-binding protein [Chlamydiae bacterium]|nr:extracellular solute-binding protein [Chlamydiota bacterium]
MNIKKLFFHIVVILLWVGIIFAALYFPNWKLAPYEKNSITIFAWGDILDPEIISEFERKTGIKIHLNFYSSNEELLVKLRATETLGYDLIIPSDYAVPLLIKENLLKELAKTKLTFINDLNPLLMGHFFDPENRYSIPFEWEIFGLGVDQDFFHNVDFQPSWQLLFEPTFPYKIAMLNDPVEAVSFAALYLYQNTEKLSQEELAGVRNLLIGQKKSVEAYADFRADYFLATKNCPVALASSSYIWRSKRIFPFIKFVIPKEGTFITIENLCIPILSKKEELVYQFINYLYTPESMTKHYKLFGFFPASLKVQDIQDELDRRLILGTKEDFSKYHFFKNLAPMKEIRDLWVEVKMSN